MPVRHTYYAPPAAYDTPEVQADGARVVKVHAAILTADDLASDEAFEAALERAQARVEAADAFDVDVVIVDATSPR